MPTGSLPKLAKFLKENSFTPIILQNITKNNSKTDDAPICGWITGISFYLIVWCIDSALIPNPALQYTFSSKIKGIVGRESNEHGKRCCFFSCWSWCRVNKISTDYPFKTPRIIKDQRSRLIVSGNQYEEQSILPKLPPLYLKGYFRENRPTNLLLLQYCQEYQNRGIFRDQWKILLLFWQLKCHTPVLI